MLDTLVLAAGKSTRIRPVAGDLPKPLIEIGGRAVIEHSLEWLAGAGVTRVWINLHYRPEAIRDRLGDGSRYGGLTIRYAHEPEILGTAGGWRNVAPAMRGTSLVVYGDNLMRFDLAAFLAAHRAGGAPATIAVFDRAVHRHSGIAGGRVVVDRDGVVTAFVEGGDAGENNLVNAGAYLLEPEIREAIPPGFRDFARDVFPRLVDERALRAHLLEPDGYCLGLDTPESFDVVQRLLSGGEVLSK